MKTLNLTHSLSQRLFPNPRELPRRSRSRSGAAGWMLTTALSLVIVLVLMWLGLSAAPTPRPVLVQDRERSTRGAENVASVPVVAKPVGTAAAVVPEPMP